MVGLCRLCASLKKAELLINVTESADEICDKLQKCCSVCIQVNDTMPKSACQSCLEKLNLSYEFYAKVQEAQETLKALFPTQKNATRPHQGDRLAQEIASVVTKSAPVKEFESVGGEAFTPKNIVKTIKLEKVDIITQKTLKSLYPNQQAGRQMSNETTVSFNPRTQSASQQVAVKRQKRSPHQVKRMKIENVFSLPNGVSENDEASNGDGYLQEVYSILGMTSEDVDDNQHTILDAHEPNDDIVIANLNKEEDNHLVVQEEPNYVEIEEHHILEDDADGIEDESNNTEQEIHYDNVELGEIVLDENYQHKDENELPYERVEINLNTLDSWTSYKHICFACNHKPCSFQDLMQHALEHHSIMNKDKLHYKCYDCFKEIASYNDFLNHVRLKHHPSLKLRCDACDMRCDDFQQYERHRDSECAESTKFPRIASCPQCGKALRTYTGKQTHIKQHVSGSKSSPPQPEDERLQCRQCPEVFLSKMELKQHLKYHSTKVETHTCELCEKIFLGRNALDAHMKTHSMKEVFKCNLCRKEFKSITCLENHQASHMKKEKPFNCSFCTRQFRTKIEQTTHERVHTGEMPLECSLCEKRFRFRSALSAHLKTHSGVRSYTCSYCCRQFNDISNFKKHVRRKHGEE